MILFKPEHVEPILQGRKTQTRRVGKCRWRIGSIHQAKTDFKKGSKPFALLRIVSVRRERLGDITEEDARKEGYPTVEAYREVFRKIYRRWDDSMMVWVIDFEVVSQQPEQEQGTKILQKS